MVKKYNVGKLRSGQLLLNYGVGAIVDLPHIATLIMGLDYWDTQKLEEIEEPRLLQAMQSIIGSQLKQLLTPSTSEHSAYQADLAGVPVVAFPRWMVCPSCRLLTSVDAGFFELHNNPYRPDRNYYVHRHCPRRRNPIVVPARFMIACDAGHLDDFPWHHFVHGAKECQAVLYMNERGVSGELSDIFIECHTCNQSRPMSHAMASNDEDEKRYEPSCTGHSPHLRKYSSQQCTHQAKTMLLSASNTWFPLVYSLLSIPEPDDRLGRIIEQNWRTLQNINSSDNLKRLLGFLPTLRDELVLYSPDTIWKRIDLRRARVAETVRPRDLKVLEWKALTDPLNVPHSDDFEITATNLPSGYDHVIQQVVRVERLHAVLALAGFTRIESLSAYAEDEELPRDHIMQLSSRAPEWIPATEVRGEGIFIQFREKAIQNWLQKLRVREHNELFHQAHRRWREMRQIEYPEANYPDIRYVFLHTFSHALLRQLTLACGYAAASIRERIYALPPTAEGGPMAGILLYTASSDSEGTLGGLVSLGSDPGFHINRALEDMEYCSSDPLCAEHASLSDTSPHGAACHACLFIPEASCERGNKYLDRSVLIPTIKREDLAFF